MTISEYQFVRYTSEHKLQVVDLERHHWGSNSDENLAYFEWKHEQNPNTQSPAGIVALDRGKVVGFFGLFANRFEAPGRCDKIIVLEPCDVCVHPEHRRRGLFVSMGRKTMVEFSSEYPLLFDTSCGKQSLPGFLKLGFVPIVDRVFLNRSPLLALARYIPAARNHIPFAHGRVRLGRYNHIVVADGPRPAEMSSLSASEERREGVLRLVRDSSFYEWRFRNPRGKYAFYFLEGDRHADGFVVVRVSRCNRRGYIVDFATRHAPALQRIMTFILQSGHYDILSVYGYCLDDPLSRIFRQLGFSRNSLLRVIEKRFLGQMPLLLRPVTEPYAESDFFVEGLDIREIQNWSLKPIFDSAA